MDSPRYCASRLASLRQCHLGRRSTSLQLPSTKGSSRLPSWSDMSPRQLVSIAPTPGPTARLTAHSCEKNYGPGIRGRHIAHDAGSDDKSDNVLANGIAARAVSDDNDDVTQSSPLQPLDLINLSIGSGIYSATTSATTSVTNPDVPYSDGSDPTCTDYSSAPATTTTSNTISFWPLPTICFKSPALCGTEPSLWTIHLDKTKSPRTITPAAQTAHRERPQGWLAPPRPQVVTSPSQTGYIGSTEANPDYPITLTTNPVRIAEKVPTAHVMGPTQDPQVAHLEHPALNLDMPPHGRVRRTFSSHDQASEPLPMELDARAKIPKPQPQTARAMGTGAGLGGPQIGGPDNGHPVDAGSSPGKLSIREEDEQTSAEDRDTDTATDSIWASHANHVRGPADSFMVALMVTISSALVLVMIF